MGRTKLVADREQLHVNIMKAQADQIDRYAALYSKTKTEIIEEALQYWLNEQERLYGDKLRDM